jgi:hypothetical protein
MPSAPEFEAPQGTPFHSVQLRAISESLAGNGVVNNGDLEVTATATDLEIQVAAGTYFYIATNYSLGAAETHTLSVGDGTNDRWDTVYFDTATQTSGVREGTPAQNPVAPDIQSDEVLLAVVYVPSGATDVPDSDILNWRAKFSNEAEEVHYNDTPGVYPGNSVEDALDELQEAAQISAYPLSIATDTEASAYPLANSDLANSSITLTGGTGVTVSGSPVSLGGSVTISTDTGVVDLEFVRSNDNTITGTLAQYSDNIGTAGALVDAPVTSGSTAGTLHSYSLAVDGQNFAAPAAESDGAGGIQNARLSIPVPLLLLAQSAAPGYTGQGAAFYDTDDETPKYADSGGTYQRPQSRPNVESFNCDESGSVASGNSGVMYVTEVPDQDTFEVLEAGLLLADGQPAPTDLDLVIATLDGSGTATLQSTVIDGDGTSKPDETGSPLASYQNTSGGAELVALLIDNGNFNAGTGSSQDIVANAQGEVA